MNNQQPKSPREWWIDTYTNRHEIADSEEQDEYYAGDALRKHPGQGPPMFQAGLVHVIERSHHVAEVARLTAEMAEKRRIIELAIKTTDHALDDRDRWKSCAVKLAEGLRAARANIAYFKCGGYDTMLEKIDGALKHFDGMEK